LNLNAEQIPKSLQDIQMNSPDPIIAALVDAQSAAIGLPLDPAHRPGTIQNLEIIARMAQALMSQQLPAQTEPAPVFSHDRS